jgi:hypothetical protein
MVKTGFDGWFMVFNATFNNISLYRGFFKNNLKIILIFKSV